MTDEIKRYDPKFGDELFAEHRGQAAVSFDELAALEDGGAEFVQTLKDYIATHPKLEVQFLKKTTVLGDDLIVLWKWRA